MWAHYAESHRGMCIQYRFKKEFFYEDETKLSFRRVRKETYTNISPDLSDSINISEALLLNLRCGSMKMRLGYLTLI